MASKRRVEKAAQKKGGLPGATFFLSCGASESSLPKLRASFRAEATFVSSTLKEKESGLLARGSVSQIMRLCPNQTYAITTKPALSKIPDVPKKRPRTSNQSDRSFLSLAFSQSGRTTWPRSLQCAGRLCARTQQMRHCRGSNAASRESHTLGRYCSRGKQAGLGLKCCRGHLFDGAGTSA